LKKSARKYMQEDIHRFVDEGDFENAVNVLRDGMKATHVVRRSKENGERGVDYEEVPDHSTRIMSAKLTLEYAFGKPATRHDITMTKETSNVASPAEIMDRLRDSGAQLADIIDVYSETVKEVPLEIENG
jgi:Arc/MetJ-type ribon-helix-helix transcriptional regulator